jgi:hypothetical protein
MNNQKGTAVLAVILSIALAGTFGYTMAKKQVQTTCNKPVAVITVTQPNYGNFIKGESK